ncbi:hypothetical protein P0Y43_23055 [Pseudomonas entomophila]|uniref:hypothetical protein n=1 Tax=Pseudomonas entomophila TaxID=312306 RepID=UPI0023D7D4D4|nr:hypothetical protein [Pseudomonas entomophila]MDF0733575.1 hypothetical protein [Pseudomonas entomophila]
MDNKTKRTITVFYLLTVSLPGPISLAGYKLATHYYPELALGFYANRKELASIVASYAFTMLGFLAAVMAILLSFSHSNTFRQYRKNQYLSVFFSIYFYCLATLAATFLASLLALSSSLASWSIQAALTLSLNSMVQVLIIGLAISSICRKAMRG